MPSAGPVRESSLRGRLTAGRRALDAVVVVRIHAPQLVSFWEQHPELTKPVAAKKTATCGAKGKGPVRFDVCTLCGIAGRLGDDVLLGVCNRCAEGL